jgi:probable F420-dependent oxidoreductase
MSVPRIGVSLPHFGPYVGPDAVATVAQAAERYGFHAVSVSERLLMPVRADWTNDAELPEWHVWDPLEILTWAAAHTRRIRVSTGIVNAIFQSPIVLARRLATLDQLSRGRLDAGLGQGGGGTAESAYLIPEEFTAAGVPIGRRGSRFVEHVAAMRACWGPDPVEFRGEHYQIPRSTVGPKPYAGTIPLFFGANVRPAVERAARLADGIVLVALDWDEARTKIGWYRDAGGTGTVVLYTIQRDPGGDVTAAPFIDAVLSDLERARAVGADEMHITLNLVTPTPPDRQAELLGALAAALGLGTAEVPRDIEATARGRHG